MKKLIPAVLVSMFALGLILTPVANAQTSQVIATPITPWCRGFIHNLSLGTTDVSTGGEVSILQNFLVSQGLLNIPPGVSTGYFGPLTLSALARFQASAGVYPSLGFFGPLTRAHLQRLCGTVSRPSINSLSPSRGPVGTSVTIYGSGFTSVGNTVNLDGGGAVWDLQSFNETSITFTIPNSFIFGCNPSGPCPAVLPHVVQLGNHFVSISNSRGTSNSVTFTVTSGQNDVRNPVINSVSAPTTLSVNETGTWRVRATDPENGTLTYSVDWGDNFSFSNATGANASPIQTVQQSSSFTHSYSQPGTYTQTFIVRNEEGGEARTTTTVRVGGSSNTGSIHLDYLSPTSGSVGTYVTIHGNGFSNSSVHFGSGYISPNSYGQSLCASNATSCSPESLTFQVPQYMSPCRPNTDQPCLAYVIQVTPGTYPVTVINNNGTSNTLYFTVPGTTQPS